MSVFNRVSRTVALFALTVAVLLPIACQSNTNAVEQFRVDFDKFTRGVVSSKKEEIARHVSRNFNDKELDYGRVVEIFAEKGAGYSSMIKDSDVNAISDDRIEVSYQRVEKVDGKVVRFRVNREVWVKSDDGIWTLFQLSVEDKEQIEMKRRLRKEELEKLFASLNLDNLEKEGVYFPGNARDPFESLIVEVSASAGLLPMLSRRCDAGRTREFMESFELMSLKLVGVLFVGNYIALVETPNGKGYTVKQGMHIGRNCGRVHKITENAIEVHEVFILPKGDKKTRTTELKLKQEES